ncbi:MAG: bifunctional precorrin-2 dehydrogenase/sirohydrochlorin ferrochelatase, partial [Gammaproteobacteria bacterium]
MTFLPIVFNAKGRLCLVVGGGDVAVRKIARLLQAEAQVRVVSPTLNEELTQLLADNRIDHKAKNFSAKHLDDCALVIAATDDGKLNQRVSELAQA